MKCTRTFIRFINNVTLCVRALYKEPQKRPIICFIFYTVFRNIVLIIVSKNNANEPGVWKNKNVFKLFKKCRCKDREYNLRFIRKGKHEFIIKYIINLMVHLLETRYRMTFNQFPFSFRKINYYLLRSNTWFLLIFCSLFFFFFN